MKKIAVLAMSALLLGGCNGPIELGAAAAIDYATKPGEPPPADIEHQIPPHESWCYSTMGDTQCYAHIQDVPPNRLVNVDPQEHYPVDLHEYHEALTRRMAAVPATAAPAVLEPGMTSDREKELLKQEIHDADTPGVPIAGAIVASPPAAIVTAAPVKHEKPIAKKPIKKKKKKHKKPAPPPSASPPPAVPDPEPTVPDPVPQ